MRTGIRTSLDGISHVLVVGGALTWGLVGIFGLNLIAGLSGSMNTPSRIVYAIIGLVAAYDLLSLPARAEPCTAHAHRRLAPAQT